MTFDPLSIYFGLVESKSKVNREILMITKRQKEVLDFVKSYKKKKDYAPSLEEIKKHLGLSSVSTAHHHVKKLQDAGYIYKGNNQPRSVLPAGETETMEIPISGAIAAGEPIEAIENTSDTITITKDDIGKHGRHYALRVEGSSMIDEGIFDGDMVIIRDQKTADNGQTVVAIVDDNQATLKKFYKENDRFRLQPANPNLLPIYKKDVEIRGVVVKIIRNLESPTEEIKRDITLLKRRIDYSWDYKGENIKTFTHGLHTYPAMFIPQVAKRLIQTYSQKGDTICDIFCGSGTALVESRLSGRNSYGIDLNPLAAFLAKAKTTEIDPSKLSKSFFRLLDRIDSIKDNKITKPEFLNIDFWFKERIIYQLAKIKKAIFEIKDKSVRNFFLVGFSEIVRLCSNTKSDEFKLVRKSPEKLSSFDPDVLGIFKKKTEFNIGGMSDYYRHVDKDTTCKVVLGDASKDNGIPAESVDCIITSPPYGDSRTTVAYGQFSRLSAQWIDIFDDPNKASAVDNNLLGGKGTKDLLHSLYSTHLNDTISKVSKCDKKRAGEVLSFYIDLDRCLKHAHKLLKQNKYLCLVIGNRLVKQVRIPTDFIVAELGEKIGFVCEDIIVRNIPGKRMPLKTSPTNIVGELEETMIRESIVILKKIKG